MKTHLINLIKETPSLLVDVIKWSGRMNPLIAPVKLIATIISIATGGSAEKKKLVVCRISAGFLLYSVHYYSSRKPCQRRLKAMYCKLFIFSYY